MHKTMNIHGESFVMLFTCMETLRISSIIHQSDTQHPAKLVFLVSMKKFRFFSFF